MPLIIVEFGALLIMAKYVTQKNVGGVYYFRRRIPEDVQKEYRSINKRGELYFSLKTKSLQKATKEAHRLALEQDTYWQNLRSGEILAGPETFSAAKALLGSYGLRVGQHLEYDKHDLDPDDFLNEIFHQAGVFGPEDMTSNWKDRLPPVHRQAAELFYGAKLPVFLSDALREYQKLKGENPDAGQGRNRAKVVSDFIALFGDLPIEQYTRVQANELRDHMLSRGNATSSVKRRLNDIRPVFRVVSREHEIENRGIFDGIVVPKLGEDRKERCPFTLSELSKLQANCIEADDDIRWLAALLSDSGLRLSEAVGLREQDVLLDGSTPHARIIPHEVRGLKTKGSERLVPLVGASLWAARKVIQHSQNGFLFPRYIDFKSSPYKHKGTYASNTLNKWARGFPLRDPSQKSMHSFRHSVQDRLREAQVPEEIRNAICGWQARGMGANYGQGFSIEVLTEHHQKIVNQDLFPINNTSTTN